MKIGLLTSGGDAPGMNAALRGAVRAAMAMGAEVAVIREGYAGLVEGGDCIATCDHDTVSNVMQLGGTVLGTARCPAFRHEATRRTAVRHAIAAGLSRLIVIGGDGSLTGAERLSAEWPEHVTSLLDAGEVTAEQAAAHGQLMVVGLVGSIDNDMVGTDTTIGCDSALHRLVDAMDAVKSTARSHQRAFVFEVMGRRCGYLALASAISAGADHVLLPEAPHADWRERVVSAVTEGRRRGKRRALVVLAEGARDPEGRPIVAEAVRVAIEEDTGVEARVTNLGHVQRGGTPSAYDRVTSTVLGVRAAATLVAMAPGDEPLVMTTRGPEVEAKSLRACLAASDEVELSITGGRSDEAVRARGAAFADLFALHQVLSTTREVTGGTGKRLLLAHVGAPAPGMNSAVRTFARVAAAGGHQPLVALEGLQGFVADAVEEVDWLATEEFTSLGGTSLGTSRWWPRDGDRVVALDAAFSRHAIDGVVLVGGFETLRAALQIDAMGMPVAVVPATISNNVPGTDHSLGCDTAVNVIAEAVDRLKQSALGSRRRVFVVEVMGRASGYLAAIAGIATGAEVVYTHADGIDLERLRRDVARLGSSFDEGRAVGLVLVADGASEAYDAATLTRIYRQEAGGRFDTRLCVLGHLQQGGRPSPRDRLAGARLASRAVAHLTASRGAVVIGLRGDEVVATPCATAMKNADVSLRRPRHPPHTSLVAAARVDALTR
jgi:6-phosphofructokinase 1